ncbi:MAG: alpha/beta hydrolase fold domain-containing protein, partial [Roseibium sp.]
GYGQSSGGVPSNRTMVEDGVAILNHLLDSGVAPERIVLHGYSMGGNIAANVLQAAEAKKKRLGGLFLDRPMEKLSTGAGALASTNIGGALKTFRSNYILAPIARGVAKFLAESYNTGSALKGIQKNRDLANQKLEDSGCQRKEWTPIVGVYDDDPIGATTKRLFKAHRIEHIETGSGHGDDVSNSLEALKELRDETAVKKKLNSKAGEESINSQDGLSKGEGESDIERFLDTFNVSGEISDTPVTEADTNDDLHTRIAGMRSGRGESMAFF